MRNEISNAAITALTFEGLTLKAGCMPQRLRTDAMEGCSTSRSYMRLIGSYPELAVVDAKAVCNVAECCALL